MSMNNNRNSDNNSSNKNNSNNSRNNKNIGSPKILDIHSLPPRDNRQSNNILNNILKIISRIDITIKILVTEFLDIVRENRSSSPSMLAEHSEIIK